MKYFIVTVCMMLVVIINSCSKTSTLSNNIIGKWYIVNDLIPDDLSGVASSGGGVNYTGTLNDYYDFTTNNILYLKEGLRSDTATYIASGNQVSISYYPNQSTIIGNGSGFSGVSGNYIISNVTPTTMTLTTSFHVQGGEETEIINLKR